MPFPRLVPVLATIATMAALLPLGAADTVPPNPAMHAGAGTTPVADGQTTHSWELPALTVRGERWGLREQDLVGSYEQPRWSTRRRFTETRAYVIPEGQFEFEYWLTIKDHARGDKDGDHTVQQQYEVEMGLPYRFQIDLYQSYEKEGTDGPNALSETKFEVRWALANWGVIWGNPTLYAEWAAVNNDADVAEFKLLLADDLAPAWIWAVNAVYEARVGGDLFHNYELTGALAYAVIDSKFSVGVETKFAWEDTKDDRGNFANEILLGPSIQYRPVPQMHIDLAVMPGLTDESPVTKTVMIAGWEF